MCLLNRSIGFNNFIRIAVILVVYPRNNSFKQAEEGGICSSLARTISNSSFLGYIGRLGPPGTFRSKAPSAHSQASVASAVVKAIWMKFDGNSRMGWVDVATSPRTPQRRDCRSGTCAFRHSPPRPAMLHPTIPCPSFGFLLTINSSGYEPGNAFSRRDKDCPEANVLR